ncbi:FkbM family methyltransferase [Gammaproteobacteria bacterium]|nr:FkbM family methyltransferase [Gammaproteobacteria bacterium]
MLLNRFRQTAFGRYGQPIFLVFGNLYRHIVSRVFPRWTVQKYIGRYGPFRLSAKFLFSDFESWGQRHNAGFDQFVNESKHARCVLDVGAHIGLTTLPVAKVINQEGTVFAFEPGKVNSKFLEMHISANRLANVDVIKSLVGDENKENTSFFESEDVSGMNSIAEIRTNHQGTAVDMVTLDTIVDIKGLIPEIIKIDVEGAELKVLRGAKRALTKHRPVLFLSVHPRQLRSLGDSPEALLDLIVSLGYTVLQTGESSPFQGELEFGEYKLIKTVKSTPH